MIVDLAVSDQKTAMEFVKLGAGEVSPLPSIMYAYAEFLHLMEEGEFTKENYQKMIEKN